MEIWTENVSIGQEPDSGESVGSGAFCIEREECSMYILPLSGPTPCADCEDYYCEMLWCEHCRFFACFECWKSCTSDYCAYDE